MRSRRKQLKTFAGTIGVCEIKLQKQLNGYALNLLDHHEITGEYLAFVISLISAVEKKEFVDCIYANVQKLEGSNYDACLDPLNDDDDLARNILRDMNIFQRKVSTRKIKQLMRRFLMRNSAGKKQPQQGILTDELKSLAGLFLLNEEELRVVSFLYCYSQSSPFETLCDKHGFPSYIGLLSIAAEIPVSKVKKIITKQGRLLQSGIVDDYETRRAPFVTLASDIVDYLAGINETPLAEKYIKKDTGTTYPLDTFNIPETGLTIVKALLSGAGPCNILLYGTEGTGKTEFAKAVTASCGKQAFFIQHGDDGSISDRRLSLIAASGTVAPDKGVIIVDEADMVLNTEMMFFFSKKTMDKGWLNNFLDQCRAKLIWVTNCDGQIAGSVLRRFSYSWHFRKFTARERRNVWQAHLQDHPLKNFITDGMVCELSSQYQVNAGGIGSALEAIKTIVTPETADQEHVRTVLKELLSRHQALTTHEAVQSFNPLTGFYDISALNTDVNSGQLLTALKGFVNRTGRKEGGNMNLLFWGLPGTGKTEFAKYLAHETGMDLIIKRASDLLSCYVGETEKSIRAAFDEAKRQGAILMIDEADSFLSTRDMAVRSWEITQVNELLTQMENHTGALICCTNLLQTLDNASLRRFNWKIEFKPLTEKGKLLLYRRYFCIEGRFPADAQERRIMAIPHLTAGDMKAVWLKTRFMEQRQLSHEGLISMLENEVRYKEKATGERVGF